MDETGFNDTALESKSMASVRVLVTAFLQTLYQFLRQTELHDSSNEIFGRALTNLFRGVESLRKVPEIQTIEIHFRGEQIWVNDIRIRPKMRQFRTNRFLTRFMRERQLSSVEIPTVSSKEELKEFLWTIAGVNKKLELDESQPIWSYTRAEGIRGFKVGSLAGPDGEKRLDDLELVGLVLHEKIRKFVDVCFENLQNAEEFELSNLKSLLKDLITLPEDDLLQIFRTKMMKRTDRVLSSVAADSCFLAAAWGRALGLPGGVVLELAGAALTHPILYLARGSKIDMSAVTSRESAMIQAVAFKLSKVWKMTDLQRLAAVEWGQPFESSGVYEWNGVKCYAHFFSRAVRIIAGFKALTHLRAGGEALLPDEAMASLLTEERQYDPVLLKLFVNWMGIYPVGSLVELQSGEVAQVFAAGSDPLRFKRPIVSVLKDSEGKVLDRPLLVDLTEMNERLGVYRRTIKRSLAFKDAGLSPEFLELTPVSL